MIHRRRTAVMGVLIAIVAAIVAPAPGASAADSTDLRTTITSVSPSRLAADSTITLAGNVTNDGSTSWTGAQAYLVIRPAPLTSRTALATAVRDDPGFAGPRVVEPGSFDEIGDLAPGTTRSFTISIPADQLPISGADGVYPVGVQILATDAGGTRSNDAVSRAVTLLPRMTADHGTAPTTVVWPFLMPSDPGSLKTAIAPGGQLRSLLDLALARGAAGRGVIVDPALVLAADDLAGGRGDGDESLADQQIATQFRDDLVSISSGPSAWVLDYDRTDVLGLVDDAGRRRRLFGAVERATESVVQAFGLSRQRVSWPVTGGVTGTLLSTLRARGTDPVVVNSSDLSRLGDSTGPLVDYATSGGDLPLLVNDDLGAGLPGPLSGATLRQEVLSATALAALSREASSGSRAAALVIVSPFWSPVAADNVPSDSWSAPFSVPTNLDAVPRDSSFTGSAPRSTTAKKLPSALLDAADRAFRAGEVIRSASAENRSIDGARARSVAGVLGVRWRTQRAEGTRRARRLAQEVTQELRSISVMGPPSVTLSSSAGAFPLTVTNKSSEAVSVGIRLSSSNPALQLPEQKPVEIAAGERLTVTVKVDLRQQNATTVTAQLVTPGGRAFGETSEFNVRSSRVGAVLWITMAAAGLFVLLALARRFRTRRSDRPAMEPGLDDD